MRMKCGSVFRTHNEPRSPWSIVLSTPKDFSYSIWHFIESMDNLLSGSTLLMGISLVCSPCFTSPDNRLKLLSFQMWIKIEVVKQREVKLRSQLTKSVPLVGLAFSCSPYKHYFPFFSQAKKVHNYTLRTFRFPFYSHSTSRTFLCHCTTTLKWCKLPYF